MLDAFMGIHKLINLNLIMGFSPRLNLLQIRQAVPKIQVIGNFGSTQDW